MSKKKGIEGWYLVEFEVRSFNGSMLSMLGDLMLSVRAGYYGWIVGRGFLREGDLERFERLVKEENIEGEIKIYKLDLEKVIRRVIEDKREVASG